MKQERSGQGELVPYRPRRLLNRHVVMSSHRLLVLLTGLPLIIIAISGGLSSYRDSIDCWLNPALVVEASDQGYQSLDVIMQSIRKAHPNRHGSWTLEMPRSPQGTITAWFDKPKESVDKRYAPLMVSVDPYTGNVVASRFWGETFATWLMDLHSRLLLESDSRYVMMSMSIALAILTLSGLYLWWPRGRTLSSAFTIHFDRGLMRLLMDIHRLLGLVSACALLLLAFTGFHLSYPDLLESLTDSDGMAHGDMGPTVRSTAVPNAHPVSLSEAVLVARGLFPHSEVRRISTPLGDQGTYRINLRQRHELNQQHPFTTVWIDRWSGQIRAVNNPSQFSPGQIFTTWQWPLHTGEAFGNGSKPFWFIIGLTPLLLFVSGVTHWLHRKGVIQDRAIDWRGIVKNVSRTIENHTFNIMMTIRYRVYPAIRTAVLSLSEKIARRR